MAALALSVGASADVKLHNLFTEGAVLQRGGPVPVWGTARDGERVTVEIQGQKATTTASDGRWMVRLRPLRTGGPYTMLVRGDNLVTLNGILVGDVWLCSGQSNMEWPISATAETAEALAAASDENLRLFTVPRRATDAPERDVNASWQRSGTETVRGFSAVAFWFGKMLRQRLNVPIGLISTNVGGTPAEAWTRREVLQDRFPQILERHDRALANYPNQLEQFRQAQRRYTENPTGTAPRMPQSPANSGQRPTGLYNAMIAPLIPYAVKGAIWYQGESNAGQAWEYRTLFPAMIENWREDWGGARFPFLFVQLAPFMKIVQEPTESNWAELREAQSLTLKASPNTGMAVITDLGDEADIHPRRKRLVGERLALAALGIAHKERIVYSGPEYAGMSVRGDRAVLRFKHVGGGLRASGPLTGFTVAGADRKFHNATAEIVGNTVVVHSPQVKKPVAVRFGWANYPVVNLTNAEGLHASPFRTDTWPVTTQPK
jgi:sialate O-acetylesterase